MHIEFLIEDSSGKIMLERLCYKVLPAEWTFRITSYRGIGSVPKKGAYSDPDVIATRALLGNLPRLLEGYGKTYAAQEEQVAVIVVCDLDQKDHEEFERQLAGVLSMAPHHLFHSYFCLAVEEGEAWLLGDKAAVLAAYPKSKRPILNRYQYDSICGTWELLADVVSPGGRKGLIKKGYQAVGQAKCEWAERITPLVNVDTNRSQSFHNFVATIRRLAGLDKEASNLE